MATKKKSVAFYERNSWYHRTKELAENGTVRYGKKGGFLTQEEAEESYYKCEEEFQAAQRKIQLSGKMDKEVMFKDYLVYWFEEEFSKRIETTTRMVGAYVIYQLILPNVDYDVKMRYINVEYLDGLLEKASKSCASAGNKCREILNLVMKEAVIDGYIGVNPVTETKPYKRKKPNIVIFSKEKLKIFLKAASKDNWYLEILLALFCGLRKGEILGLKFSDFDMEKHTVKINRQIVSNPIIKENCTIEEYQVIEREPKTQNSFRTLRVPDVILEELEKRKILIDINKSKLQEDYMDGSEISQQKSGFSIKKAASADRDKTMGELYAGTYVVYANVRVKDYLSFWLEEEMRPKITNSTYETYRHVIRKYIDAEIGHIRMIELKRSDVQKLYNETANKAVSAAKHAKTIMNTSMRYALNKKIISVNPATYVSLPKMIKKEKYHTRNIDTKKTLNVEQMLKLIEASKDTPIHIQVLFAALLGLRRSEINGVKYSDIDYINRTLTVQRQLGKKPKGEEEDLQGRSSAKQEIGLKTSSSYRTVPLPDYVFEAILEERKKYERNRRRRRSVFQDFDYICCSNQELCFVQFFVVCPRSKDYYWKYFKKLLKENNLPDIRWHDLRSSFCTLLLKNDFNPKAVSKLMGHAKEIITIDVYGDKAEIIEDCLEELQPFIDEVLPGEEKVATDFSEDDYVECFGSFLA